jgi:hypothetical protein
MRLTIVFVVPKSMPIEAMLFKVLSSAVPHALAGGLQYDQKWVDPCAKPN